jgi:hypothetical protein
VPMLDGFPFGEVHGRPNNDLPSTEKLHCTRPP